MEINERLFALIKSEHLKKSELAEFLQVGTGQITTWEKRKTDPPAKHIVRICEFLNVSVEYLLTGNESIKNEKKALDLTKNEMRLLQSFNRLEKESEQIELIGYINGYIEKILNDNTQTISINSDKKMRAPHIAARGGSKINVTPPSKTKMHEIIKNKR